MGTNWRKKPSTISPRMEVKAVMQRRDKIVKQFQKLIAEKGEERSAVLNHDPAGFVEAYRTGVFRDQVLAGINSVLQAVQIGFVPS